MINADTAASLRIDGVERSMNLVELEQWGRQVGALIAPPMIIALRGELGAGKTTLTRAICEGFGVTDSNAVTSPTYAILQQYDAPNGAVVHADLYRLKTDRELESLGWDEIVNSAHLLIVEWPERALSTLPRGTCVIELAHHVTDSAQRLLTATIT